MSPPDHRVISVKSFQTNVLWILALALLAIWSSASFAESTQLVSDSWLERVYGPYAPYIRSFVPKLTMIGSLILIALPLQALFPAVKREPKIRTYEYWLDLIYSFQSFWLGVASFYVVVQTIKLTIYGAYDPWLPQLSILPDWLQVLLAIWAFDFVVYWRHRFEHMIPALWSFHAVHHSTKSVDVLTTNRLHPIELALGAVTNAIVAYSGLSLWAVALGYSIYLYYNYFIHTNVKIRFSGWLKYILVSPFMHQWHHAVDKESIGKNVGVVFAWNDWLFRSAYHPDHWPTKFGIDAPTSEQMPQSYIRQLLYPLQFAWIRLFRPLLPKKAPQHPIGQ